MMLRKIILVFLLIGMSCLVSAQTSFDLLRKQFKNPDQGNRPWVIWYWIHGAVSKEGIKADLEAMHDAGVAGAYLMFIKDTSAAHFYQPTVRQLSPEWFDMVKLAVTEAKRLNVKIGLHISDGFALAGGPWITPELSMQKVVWATYRVGSNTDVKVDLPVPTHVENYYEDIAVFAIRQDEPIQTTSDRIPVITTSNQTNAQFLVDRNNDQTFRADSSIWIQYTFNESFNCRTILIKPSGNNFQSMRLVVQSSDDGIVFKTIKQLEPPRHGWQNVNPGLIYSIPATDAKFFRFIYDKNGTEPGAEDLDNAKWKANLKIKGIMLSSEALIDQYRGKTGEVWRVSKPLYEAEFPREICKQKKDIINISSFVKNGKLVWNAPKGNWLVLRMGHTSTGMKNETAGGGKGLECDKFNSNAVELQINNWYDKIIEKVGTENAKGVVNTLHIDSWECGSQNWGSNFLSQFKQRRGYDLLPYMPLYAGIPIESVDFSEKILRDIRLTMADLVSDVFFKTVKKMAVTRGVRLTAESTAPTMVGDGMLHYKHVDIPMGEFWLKSPTHDKPNDMLDAISAAHIYNKNIVGSESFTQLRMDWDEHPGLLKVDADRNFALGVNKMDIHVFVHNPWLDRKPGYTLDGIGSYFQRDQTWFKQSKFWLDYITRVQTVLQTGKHVADIAVFTGDEIPRRSVLPDRLINIVPGLIGEQRVAKTIMQFRNDGQPSIQQPAGVYFAANMVNPKDWVNPLNGYAYDSFNPDALSTSFIYNNELNSFGASYKLLVIPGNTKMNPGNILSDASAHKIMEHVRNGLSVLIDETYLPQLNKLGYSFIWKEENRMRVAHIGKGLIVIGPITQHDLSSIGIYKDISLSDDVNPSSIGYTHRKLNTADVYFLSNQTPDDRNLLIGFRTTHGKAEIWNTLTGEMHQVNFTHPDGAAKVNLHFDPNGSLFVIFHYSTPSTFSAPSTFSTPSTSSINLPTQSPWSVQFDTAYGGPATPMYWNELIDWTTSSDSLVKYYSGTAVYSNTFNLNQIGEKVYVKLDHINNLATVKINGKECGTIWTYPFQVDVTKALRIGENKIELVVTNTWANRLNRDQQNKNTNSVTYTTSPYSIAGRKLLPAGIVGKIKLVTSDDSRK